MAAVIEFPAATAPSVGDLRARFREGKRELIDEFRAARPTAAAASRLIRTLCQHVDTALLGLWTHAAMPEGAGLVAVGGYGRGELFPHSDVDVLVLLAAHPAGTADAANASVEAFITACWDIGLEIGSSVRTVDECVAMAQSDLTVQTSFLDSRYLCGSRAIFGSFNEATAQVLDPKAKVEPQRSIVPQDPSNFTKHRNQFCNVGSCRPGIPAAARPMLKPPRPMQAVPGRTIAGAMKLLKP